LVLTAIANISALAKVDVKFGKFVYITGGFKNGFEPGYAIQFSLKGFINPPVTRPTNSFLIDIFYEEGVDSVSVYEGTDLTIKCTPSPMIRLGISMNSENG
jgi:hypothetical protein